MYLNQIAIYRFSLAFILIVYADIFGLISLSDYNLSIKYSYALIILIFISIECLRWRAFDVNSRAPIIALLFFVVTAISFTINVIFYDERSSYVSAFTSSLVFAVAAFIPPSAIKLDASRILNQILFVLLLASTFYMLETILKTNDEHVKSIICVLGLCLCILAGRHALAGIFAVITVVALLMRPTSTLAIALMICIPLSLMLKFRALGLSRIIVNGALLFAGLLPFAIYYFPDSIGSVLTAFEETIKADYLSGHSNNALRLAILTEALRAFENSSILIGNGMNGNTNAFIGNVYPDWPELGPGNEGFASIHSDFVIMLTQGGLIGYGIFLAMLYFVGRGRFNKLKLLGNHTQDVGSLTSSSIVALVAVIVYCSVNPFLQQYQIAHSVWMLFFISEVVGKSTVNRKYRAGLAKVDRTISGVCA